MSLFALICTRNPRAEIFHSATMGILASTACDRDIVFGNSLVASVEVAVAGAKHGGLHRAALVSDHAARSLHGDLVLDQTDRFHKPGHDSSCHPPLFSN